MKRKKMVLIGSRILGFTLMLISLSIFPVLCREVDNLLNLLNGVNNFKFYDYVGTPALLILAYLFNPVDGVLSSLAVRLESRKLDTEL